MLPSLANQSALRLIENRRHTPVARGHDPSSLPDSNLDCDFSRTLAALGGSAARSRIHALHPTRPGDEGAATGFALTLFSHLAALSWTTRAGFRHPRPILWVQDRRARLESGVPYGLGLHIFGIDPAQLVIISTRTALDALAATEIGLETGGLDGVLAELPPNLPADMLSLGKRLALRAERSSTPCFLLHASATSVPTPVATRWQIAGRAAVAVSVWGLPVPAVDLALIKNRFGPTGHWSAPLQPALHTSGASDVCVSPLSPSLPQSLDALSVDRSHTATARSYAA